jgi:molybdenum cofactor cytidylyltransferase
MWPGCLGSLPAMDEALDRTTALVIASDRGRDFVGPKYLAMHRGRPLLQRVLDDVAGWPVDGVVVVLGDEAERVLDGIDFHGAMVVIDPEWREGVAASVRVGLDSLARDHVSGACVLARGDQVGVSADLVARLLASHQRSLSVATVPKYRYVRGWPIVVSERLWPRLMGLEGNIDLLDVLSSHPEGVGEEWFDSLSPQVITSAEDLPPGRRR